MVTTLSDEDLRKQEEEILERQTAIAEEKLRRKQQRELEREKSKD